MYRLAAAGGRRHHPVAMSELRWWELFLRHHRVSKNLGGGTPAPAPAAAAATLVVVAVLLLLLKGLKQRGYD